MSDVAHQNFGTLAEPRPMAVRFPMVLYICPWCGNVVRGPDGMAPYLCAGIEGYDLHLRAEMRRFVVEPLEAVRR